MPNRVSALLIPQFKGRYVNPLANTPVTRAFKPVVVPIVAPASSGLPEQERPRAAT